MEKCDNEKFVTSQNKSAWFSFIKSIATFKGDLASLTAPPFLLSPQSIIEFSSYWCEHPSVFVAPAREPCPEKRALLVTKWFLSTLKQQHNNRDENGKKKKMKPLNPFLGELFQGQWTDSAGRTKMVAEQVSHHPPITAYNLWNEENGIRLQGTVAPKVYFSSTVHIDRKGYNLLHIDAFDEDHLITMPKIHVEGLMTGSLQPELSGSSYIRSSSGYTTKIEYSYKGWLGGKRNSFVAKLFKGGDEQTPLYILEGVWSGEYTVKDMRSKTVAETVDVGALKRTPFTVKPIDEQGRMESRRAWQHVAAAIDNGDMFTIGKEKSKIENEQREMRKREKVEGVEFHRRYFSLGREHPAADVLMKELERETTFQRGELDPGNAGLWLWDEEKYRNVVEGGVKSPRGMSFDSGVGLYETISNA